MKQGRISIIIPVYNVENKIERCIDSILKQTFQNFEIILVNDGSKDKSLEICKKYSAKDERIKVIDKKNEGAGAARNAGLKIADGEFVVFFDSDDWVEPEILTFFMSNIKSNSDVDVAICNYYIDDEKESRGMVVNMDIPHEPYITEDIAKCVAVLDESGKFNYLWNRIYKKSIIDKYNVIFENRFTTGQDLDFNLQYFKHVKKCIVSNKPLYHYIKDGVGSLCAKYKNNLFDIVTELSFRRKELYHYLGMMNNSAYKLLYEKTYVDYIGSCIPNMFRSNAPLTYKDKLKQLKQIINDNDLNDYIKSYRSRNKIEKLFVYTIKMKKPRLSLFIYSMLFFVRNNFNSIYEKIK